VRDLWPCPRCGAEFTTPNQWHSCGRFDLDALFVRSAPAVRRLYERFLEVVRACGPVTVIPQRSRIALQVRMRFAAVMPQAAALKGHLILSERVPAACFERIDSLSPRHHVHVFRLASPRDLTPELRRLVRRAYRVGAQERGAC
jgi:hypothetical protein